MLKIAGGFARSRSGSMMPLFFLSLVPLISVVGFSVDYTSAIQTQSNQQQALDAALLSITTMDTTSTLTQRQTALQNAFIANSGQGTVTLNSFVAGTPTTATTGQASASFSMPTIFMQIARINTVPIAVSAAVSKPPALVNATFKIDKVSGYWNKTMTLYGTNFGATTAQKLMTASYVYSPYTYSYKVSSKSYSLTEAKGYGTTTISLVNGSTSTVVQTQTCTTTGSTSAITNPPSGAIVSGQYDGNSGKTIYFQTTCATTNVPATGAGAAVDVSQMGQLYLQMDVTTGNKATFKTNDATTSDYLYLGTTPTPLTEVAAGQLIDIFSVVPCSQTSYQAWEDGGTTLPATYTNADFFYNVTGKCDFNKRPSDTALTQ
ncbi:TadE/TadG family type IV pilus assembly protein [Mesorhizobium erdmanii]|uniref:TadE/TadG family type IV pilus assembly protein n=1 Tax=Mesorhizobium erdmanii TaxID=1777866 RepID=UPI0004090856|nr:pilus assembly protein TadG-related protein [Mesorhizobium erdmanii]